MKTIAGFAAALAMLVALGAGIRAQAADAPAAAAVQPPMTLWNYLGIPQGTHKVRDAVTNQNGNNPQRERLPALKQIADPANLNSPSPAIKIAAKVKADADLAPQKIKAIKYLATICCGCAKNKDDVKDALLAALDDCTEEVRYEAAMALCQCSGNHCSQCNGSGCCDAKVMNKLLKVSEGKDEQGCWLETSPRVRAVATNALNACRQSRGATTPEPLAPSPKGEAPTAPPEAAPIPSSKAVQPTRPGNSTTSTDRGVAPAGFVEPQDDTTAKPEPAAEKANPSVAPAESEEAPSVSPAIWTSEIRFQGRIVPSAVLPSAPTTP
jgi:hypothetical protein